MVIYILTDSHVCTKNAWNKFSNYRRPKDYIIKKYSCQVLKTAVDMILEKKDAEVVLFLGDLTQYGDGESHKFVISQFQRLEAEGIIVSSILDTHDRYEWPEQKYTFDEGNSILKLLYQKYGPAQAVAIHKSSGSYLMALGEDIMYLALNTDVQEKHIHELTLDLQEWINVQRNNEANRDKLWIAGIHHPIVAPDLFYEFFCRKQLIYNAENIMNFFAENRINIVLSGHTHIQSFFTHQQSVGFSSHFVNVGAVADFSCVINKLTVMPSERQARVEVVRIRNECFKTNQKTLCEYCKNQYEKYIRNVLECMDTDFVRFQFMIPSYMNPQKVMENREAWEQFGKIVRSMSAERIRKITGLVDKNKYRYNLADIITYIFLNHYFGFNHNDEDSGWNVELQSLLAIEEKLALLPFVNIQNNNSWIAAACSDAIDTIIVKY